MRPNTVVQIGLAQIAFDLLTVITGASSFDVAWSERVECEIDGHRIPFLGREMQIANKRSTGQLRTWSTSRRWEKTCDAERATPR